MATITIELTNAERELVVECVRGTKDKVLDLLPSMPSIKASIQDTADTLEDLADRIQSAVLTD